MGQTIKLDDEEVALVIDAVAAHSLELEQIRAEAIKYIPGMTPAGVQAEVERDYATKKIQQCNEIQTKLLGNVWPKPDGA